jgi:hypothetical protein
MGNSRAELTQVVRPRPEGSHDHTLSMVVDSLEER